MRVSINVGPRKIVALTAAAILLAAPALAARHVKSARGHASESQPSIPLDQIRVLGNRPAPFALDAKAAELVALRSGAVLYAYNEHVKMQPASLAKMMTFYLTLEALKQRRITLETEMPISEAAWRLSMNDSVSRMFLQVGQRVAVHDLLYGLMVSSGNDAAVVLSEYLGGSQQAFAESMNKKARQLGLDETHFTNPDGLPTDDEYTTAADMVKLGRAILESFPDATQYTGAKEFTFDKIVQRNFNTLLFYDSRVNGIKTGHVEEAGFHLVASAHSSDLDLVSAVMGTSSMEKRRVETDKLLDWAFRTFATVNVDWRKAMPAQLPVYKGDADVVAIAPAGGESYFTVDKGKENKVAPMADIPKKFLVAPFPKGTQVGLLTVMIDGKAGSSVPIETQAPVKEGGFFHRMADAIRLKL